ncbi:uncharacterized protein LOC142176701 [Nicotiana tabacum]|uniref:Uncharacterized protein LOC142176701 n=1 Tax=Nicotiana tabacum TaxID=4097 RepID=A0AC58TUS4_TOBAC
MNTVEDDNQSTPTMTESPNQSSVDISSPLYMHPSDNLGATLVPVLFDGFGYRSWRRGVIECKRPDPNSSKFGLWERCDDMVTSWILNSLAKEITDSVKYVADAFKLWRELEDSYDQTNGTKLYQIQKEINDLSQGALEVTSYYTKMKSSGQHIDDESSSFSCPSIFFVDPRGKEEEETAQLEPTLHQEQQTLQNRADSWIIDSVASNNMTFNRSLLTNIINLPYPLLVILPNGYKVKVTEIGSMTLTSKITLDKVMYVPTFRYNLISDHSLASHLNCLVAFVKHYCILHAPSMKRPLVICRVKDGMYILCLSYLKKNKTIPAVKDTHTLPTISTCCTCNTHCPSHSAINILFHTNKCVSSPIVNNSCATIEKQVSFTSPSFEFPSILSHSCAENNVNVLWHNRLGHVPFVKMKNITSIPANFSPKQPFNHTIYSMARQERLLFPQKTSTTNRIFEHLHVDLWASYHVPTHDRYKYFIIMVDDYSRFTWTHLLSSKSNALEILKNFMNLVENQFGVIVKSIKSDNGLEFTSKEATILFQSKGTPENLSDQGNADNTSDPMSPTHVASSSPSGTPISSPPNISLQHHTEQTHEEQAQSTRQSQRTHKFPIYLQDYVYSLPQVKTNPASLNDLFCVNHHIASDLLTPDSQTLVRNVCHDRESSSYEEVAIDHAWQAIMTHEFDALYSNHTWDFVMLTPGKQAISCKWVYKVKHKADSNIERFKARLVVKGHTQQAGIDYTETFSPVVKMTTVRTLIATSVKKGRSISQLDVNNAFLHGDLNEEVYMQVPPGLVIEKLGLVCKLNKSLYGLKQASRQWYAKLTEALCSRGYTHSMYDYSLFYKRNGDSSVYITVYVDDVLMTATDQQEIAQLKTFLHE